MARSKITDDQFLTRVFGRFVGQAVPADQPEQVIDDLVAAAANAGIAGVRVWTPDMMGILNYLPDRLNLHIGPDTDDLSAPKGWIVKDEYNYG